MVTSKFVFCLFLLFTLSFCISIMSCSGHSSIQNSGKDSFTNSHLATDEQSFPNSENKVSLTTQSEGFWVVSPATSLYFTKTEITVGQYIECEQAGVCQNNSNVEKANGTACNRMHLERKDHPMNCIDWNMAKDMCDWIGGRLPTLDEWYVEASNGKDDIYPWGKSPVVDCDYAAWNDPDLGAGCGSSSTWPVCSKPKGNNQNGLCDLAGNGVGMDLQFRR